jgi:hypothetical protein
VAGTGGPTLVDDRLQVSESLCSSGLRSGCPRSGCIRDLLGCEVGERTNVPRRMNDDFLALECGIEIGNNANLPAGCVGLRSIRPRVRFRRSAFLPSLVERATVAVRLRFLLDCGPQGTRPCRTSRREDDLAAGERIDAKVDRQLVSPPPCLSAARTMGPISSIGSGRISVDVRSELISSIVCR